MKYHRIKCNLYKAEGNSWEQMAEELLSSAVREERVVRLVLFTRCTDNQEYKFSTFLSGTMGGAAFRFSPSGRFACGSKTVGGELGAGGTFIGGGYG